MKLTKADYMRLSKERLAELLEERDNEVIQPIVIPSQPAQPSPYDPYKPYEPWKVVGPTITYADSPNTNETKGDPNLHAYLKKED
jgi:hypothetical protein